MFDWLRNIRQSDEDRQRERLNAYLDNALLPRDRQALEQELARDEALQAELASLQAIKGAVRQLPRVPVPRQFTLSPAMVSQPLTPPRSALYPAMRLATVLTAFLLVALLLFDNLPQVGQSADTASDMAYYEESGADEAVGNAAASSDEDDVRSTSTDDTAESAPMVAAEADTATVEEPAEDGGEAEEETAAAPTQGETSGAIAGTLTPTPTPTPTSTPTPTRTATATLTPTATAALSPTPTATPTLGDPPLTPSFSPLRLAQMSLGVLFLLLLFITLRLRRS